MSTDEREHVHYAIDPDHPGMTTPFYDLAGNRVGDPVPVESLSRSRIAFDQPVMYSPAPDDQGIAFPALPAAAAEMIDAIKGHTQDEREDWLGDD